MCPSLKHPILHWLGRAETEVCSNQSTQVGHEIETKQVADLRAHVLGLNKANRQH